MPSTKQLRIRAFAKINLDLQILGIRPDGYHELRTTFQTIDRHDTLTLRPSTGPLQIVCNDPACPVDRTNLVWRAAEAVWRTARRRGAPEGVRVTIDKRIPMQAGLGGGSSDGAAALRAFARFWRVAVGGDRMRRLAAALGADVPFFLEGGTAIGVDRGDRLQRTPDRRPAWVVLALPDFGVSTAEAFGWWDAANQSRADPPRPYSGISNDLQSVVAAKHPEIEQIVDALLQAGASEAAMSGSGSAVFGLFTSKRLAAAAAGRLATPARRTLVARMLSRARFQKLSRPV